MLDTIKDLGFDGVEANRVLTREFVREAQKRDLEVIHPTVIYEPDGSVDEKYMDFIKSLTLTDVSMLNSRIAAEMKTLFHNMRTLPDSDFRYKGIPGSFGSYDQALRAAESARLEAEIAAQYGLRVFYHNHTHEFRVDRGAYVMDIYLQNTPDHVVMQLDVGWALCAGIDVLSWMKKWPGRIGSLHVKPCNWVIGPEALGMTCPLPPLDREGITRDQMQAIQTYAESPQGPMSLNIVDWAEIFQTAISLGCETFIHERERIYIKDDVLACVREDFGFLRNCLDKMEG